MANEQNLRPPYSPSEAREYGRKGGIESGKSKRRKRMIKETIEIVLDQPIKKPEMLETMSVLGLNDSPKYRDYLIASIVTRTAEIGTVSDLVRLADLLGETSDTDEALLDEAKAMLAMVPSCIDRKEGE